MSDGRADHLVEQLCTGELDALAASSAANDLLNYIFQGAQVGLVRRLVRCQEIQAVKAGAWIISELGRDAALLWDEVNLLLRSPARNVRFLAVDAALTLASENDAPTIAEAITLIRDADRAVRRQVLRLMSRIELDRLSSAAPYLVDPHLKDQVRWLIKREGNLTGKSDVLIRLSYADNTTRMFAAVAAVRLAAEDAQALRCAADSNDPEIAAFAQCELNALGHPQTDLLGWLV